MEDRLSSSLVKLLAAAAWADGEMSVEERATLERIGVDLDLSASERRDLQRFLEHPVGLEEAEALVRTLIPRMTPRQRQGSIGAIEKVIASDSRIDPREVRLLEVLRDAVRDAEEERFLKGIRGFFRREREGRPPAGSSGGGVVARIVARMGRTEERPGLDPGRFEQATLFGAILSRVAFADGELSDAEAARLRTLLTGVFHFGEEEAEQVLAVVLSNAAEEFDRQRLCASFNRVTEMGDRMQLLGCLFVLAQADDEISEAELREIRLIANYLWIGAREFNRIRLNHGRAGGERAT